MSNRPSHYQTKKKILREHTPCFSLNKDFISKLKSLAEFDNQTPSRVFESALNFYLLGDRYEKTYKKIQVSKKCYKNKKKVFNSHTKNKKNKIYCQKGKNLTKLVDRKYFEGLF